MTKALEDYLRSLPDEELPHVRLQLAQTEVPGLLNRSDVDKEIERRKAEKGKP